MWYLDNYTLKIKYCKNKKSFFSIIIWSITVVDDQNPESFSVYTIDYISPDRIWSPHDIQKMIV